MCYNRQRIESQEVYWNSAPNFSSFFIDSETNNRKTKTTTTKKIFLEKNWKKFTKYKTKNTKVKKNGMNMQLKAWKQTSTIQHGPLHSEWIWFFSPFDQNQFPLDAHTHRNHSFFEFN